MNFIRNDKVNMIHVKNIKKEINPFYKNLLKECENQRSAFLENVKLDPHFEGNNFYLKTEHTRSLYNLMLKECRKLLNKFTLKDDNFKCWCYFSDKYFNYSSWHKHITSSTINGVVYLKINKNNKGIDFNIKKKRVNFKPKQFDLFIFPSYLEHYPYPYVFLRRLLFYTFLHKYKQVEVLILWSFP